MKKLLVVLLFLPILGYTQDKSPNMYEVMTMEVKRGMEDKFEAAVKAHNEKYHKDGLYKARLAYNISGPSGGTYTWIMGPTNWSSQDMRSDQEVHDADWKNVDQYVERYYSPSYWSYSEKLSHVVPGKELNKRLIWAYNIKRGKGARWAELVEKVKKVYDEKLPDESFSVSWNKMANGNDGFDAVIIWGFEKWADMDRDRDFGDLFEEVHGNGSWHTFLNEFTDTVEERVDWTREMLK